MPNDRTSPEASEIRLKPTATQLLFVGAQRSTARFAPRFVSNGSDTMARAAATASSAASRAAMELAGFEVPASLCDQSAEVDVVPPRAA
jgi:hypothetical protein